ncbi:hypothetical protein BKA83DRAFT_85445 [Pisolithus microcarpus]|nr:hypothetical protein BKA83DRAFT_85445 [Pisolithus microcarpus]
MSHAPYGDTEKGTLEITPTQVTKPVEIDVFPVQSLRKDAPVSSKPPARLPKHEKIKASNYVLFIIWYNAYRRFFTVVFTLNFIGLGLAIADRWPYAKKYPGALVLGNLNLAVLMRNEVFGRILYLFVNTCFAKWTPLWFRLGCTSTLQAWFIFMVVNQYNARHLYSGSILGFGVFTVILLFITLVAGLPWVRNTHHNIFERNHRFFGWSSLISTWIYTLPVHIVLPWCCTRKVRVDVELPSPKVAVLRFERGMQQGLLARISRTAIMEYHAFGIISEGTHAKYHYLICGVQGDFTKSLVNDPPKMIWTRELKFAGVSNTSTLYKRGIRICTGTGLGAALSTCIQSPNW